MKVYVLTGDYDSKAGVAVFSTHIRALAYADQTIGKKWVKRGMNVDAVQIHDGYQILITDSQDELIATYFILGKEVDKPC